MTTTYSDDVTRPGHVIHEELLAVLTEMRVQMVNEMILAGKNPADYHLTVERGGHPIGGTLGSMTLRWVAYPKGGGSYPAAWNTMP